jgi:hypothetical protein
MKQLSVIAFGLFLCAGASSEAFAQRKAVSGAEVTGTFRSCYTGKYKGFCNEILIQARVILATLFGFTRAFGARGGSERKTEKCYAEPDQFPTLA